MNETHVTFYLDSQKVGVFEYFIKAVGESGEIFWTDRKIFEV